MTGGIYLAAFEMLKQSLMGKPKDFYCTDLDSNGEAKDKYTREVLLLDDDPFKANVYWWRKIGVFSDTDVNLTLKVRAHRNEIAHEIPKFLGTAQANVDLSLLESCYVLLSKIDIWWIKEVEATTNPDLDAQLDSEQLDNSASIQMLLLALMIPIANGDDRPLRETYEEWKKACRNKET
jgi:hypothetical protein